MSISLEIQSQDSFEKLDANEVKSPEGSYDFSVLEYSHSASCFGGKNKTFDGGDDSSSQNEEEDSFSSYVEYGSRTPSGFDYFEHPIINLEYMNCTDYSDYEPCFIETPVVRSFSRSSCQSLGTEPSYSFEPIEYSCDEVDGIFSLDDEDFENHHYQIHDNDDDADVNEKKQQQQSIIGFKKKETTQNIQISIENQKHESIVMEEEEKNEEQNKIFHTKIDENKLLKNSKTDLTNSNNDLIKNKQIQIVVSPGDDGDNDNSSLSAKNSIIENSAPKTLPLGENNQKNIQTQKECVRFNDAQVNITPVIQKKKFKIKVEEVIYKKKRKFRRSKIKSSKLVVEKPKQKKISAIEINNNNHSSSKNSNIVNIDEDSGITPSGKICTKIFHRRPLVAPFRQPKVSGLTGSYWTHILQFCTAEDIANFSGVSRRARLFGKCQPQWQHSYELYCFLNANTGPKAIRRSRKRRSQQCDVWAQVCVIGPAKCGKTCFVQRFGQNKFRNTRFSARAHHRVVNVDGLKMRLSLWDTPAFRNKRIKKFREVLVGQTFHSIFLCFDSSDPYSIKHTMSMIRTLKPLLQPENQEIFIVGLKGDSARDVAEEKRDLSQFAKSFGQNQVYYTSSKTGTGVFSLIKSCAESLAKKQYYSPPQDKKNCILM